ncbi:hypothetical protein ACFQZQ_06375 [Lysobacter koreensis]|uniref:Uncharacterized protein n=1 Tax=Lysobacter koreensis TaxID=266122 RepID=A0ABW2YN38_9GAMM
MTMLSRWLAPAVLAAGLGVAGLAPAPAQAQSNDLARVIVDVADVMIRGGVPYYRHGNYDHDDRLIVVRDRYGRPTYYRNAPRGRAYGYHGNAPGHRDMKCNKHGKCKVQYYDPRYDRSRYDHRYDNRYYSYDRRHDRDDRDDDRRWDRRRDRDDD